jgi:glycosyltransferase involved in cell wall biosynthesis
MPSPFVSVLIDTYNHDRFIEEAVNSVLAQDFPSGDREILVVDDGSTDKTPALLRKFEPHVRILRKANGGQASAFNLGVPECRGEIVVFLDGDDWWAPNKLSKVVEAFSSSPTIGLVGHSITEALPNGVRRTELVRDSPQFRIDSLAGARLFRLRKSFLGTSFTFRGIRSRALILRP